MTIQRKRVAKRLASGLLAGALALGGLAISGSSVSAKTPISPSSNRFGGVDRYQTAALLAANYGNVGTNGLIVASGETPYDALAASSLAGYIDAPVVLVRKDSIPESVADLLSDNIANFRNSIGKKVYFVGGTSAISDAVKTALMAIVTASDATPITSERISGANRYETAVAVSKVPGLTTASDVLIIANGADGQWADALSAGQIAAEKAWPIILTGNGGLNAEATARIVEYIKLSGSSLKFLLVGGPAVLPTSIENALVDSNVPVKNIYRRGGADRYHTSMLMNVALTALGSEADLQVLAMLGAGNGVALASGASPWDALAAGPWAAKKDYHLVLTASPVPGAFTAGLVGTLSAVLDQPANLYIVGGKNAVSNTVRDAVVATAQGAVDQVSALAGCVAGATSIVFAIPGGLGTPTNTRVETLNNIVTAAANAYFSADTVKDTTTDFISGFTDISVKADGITANRDTFLVSLGRELKVGEVIKFSGVDEVTPGGINQAIAGSSCTVAADTVAPSATLRVISDGAKLNSIEVTLSEPITKSLPTDNSTLDMTAASLAASTYWTGFTITAPSPTVAAANQSTLSAVALDSSFTRYLVTVTGNVNLAPLATVTLSKDAIVDVVGLKTPADISVGAVTDATPATTTLGTVTCRSKTSAVFTKAPLTVTAVSAGGGGSQHGRKANALKLRVVNQRGLKIPSIALDAAAGVIVVTADVGYHTPNDLITVANNTGFSADWAITAGATLLTATTVDVAYATPGTDACAVKVSYNEPAYTSARTLTVAGVTTTANTATASGAWATTWKVAETAIFDTAAVGAATIVLSSTTVNNAGVSGAATGSSSLP